MDLQAAEVIGAVKQTSPEEMLEQIPVAVAVVGLTITELTTVEMVDQVS